jgi:hypothetical protein
MKRIKFLFLELFYILLFIITFMMGFGSFIQAIKCPQMTHTQLFLRIPQSMIGNWKDCD